MLTLCDSIRLVRDFHSHIQAPVSTRPQLLPGHPGRTLGASVLVGGLAIDLAREAEGTKDLTLCRASMCLEELAEWLLAHSRHDLVAAADALGDRMYVLIGDAVATGLPIESIFQAVHASNMSKLKLVQSGLGKAVKGATFQRADVARILAEYGNDNAM